MKLIVDDNKFKMAKITGPRHNFLSLSIVKNKLNFDFNLNDVEESNHNIQINEDTITKQILDGLDKINKALNKNYRIEFAEYSSKDTPSENVYEELTMNIIEKAHKKGLI